MDLGKPRAVFHAELALWIWTAWTCLYGVYRASHVQASDQILTDQLQSLFAIQPESMLKMAIAGYVLVAASMAWVIFKIGDGKRWARMSLLLSFVLEIFWIANQPTSPALDYLPDIPDVGFQAYALYLLFTSPGRQWFRRASKSSPF